MKLLFLCVANSARSQMAEGLAREILGPTSQVESAGSSPSQLNPLAIAVMQEIGIDINTHYSKSVDSIDTSAFDYIITLCADEVCPVGSGLVKKLHWPFPDPAVSGLTPEASKQLFRSVRDQIKAKVKNFFQEQK